MSAETCRGGGDFLYCRSQVLLEGLCFRQRVFLPPAGQPWKPRTWRAARRAAGRAARRAGTRRPGHPVLKTAVPATRRQQPRTRLILVLSDPSLAIIFFHISFFGSIMPRKCSSSSQIRRGQKMPGPLPLVYFMMYMQTRSFHVQTVFSLYTASLRPSIFPWKFVLIFVVLNYLSVDTVHHTLLHTVVYGTHSG